MFRLAIAFIYGSSRTNNSCRPLDATRMGNGEISGQTIWHSLRRPVEGSLLVRAERPSFGAFLLYPADYTNLYIFGSYLCIIVRLDHIKKSIPATDDGSWAGKPVFTDFCCCIREISFSCLPGAGGIH
jgi:hypothetical protein